MVNNQQDPLDAVFHALADPTRRAMVARLAQSPCGISELAAPFEMTLAAASKHVKVLERAGLLVRSIEGRNHTCALDTRPMLGGLEWLRHYEQFWNQRLDVTFPQSQYQFKNEIFMLSRQLRERYWRQII